MPPHKLPHRLLPSRGQKGCALGAVLALGLGGLISTASAHSERVRIACTSDYLRLCGQYDPDSHQTTSCMRRNESRLSSDCRRALQSEGHRASTTRPPR